MNEPANRADSATIRRVLLLANPKSGMRWSFEALRKVMDRYWDVPGTDLAYQFCQNVGDAMQKVKRAIDVGVDIILVAGGDGTVSSCGRMMVGSSAALGVIPVGSGNGFARHFGVPLAPGRAAHSLANATVRRIDIGYVHEHPFLVTCSMAWDAAIVKSFEKLPLRGILPYILAGVNEFIGYQPQPIKVIVDQQEELLFEDPVVFTIANVTQYGGGAKIAPHARPDDGYLELVVALRQDLPTLVTNVARFFDGSLRSIPEIVFRRFKTLEVQRSQPGPIQIDGELVDMPAEVKIEVMPAVLNVLVPRR